MIYKSIFIVINIKRFLRLLIAFLRFFYASVFCVLFVQNHLRNMKIGCVPINDMQTPAPPLKSGQIGILVQVLAQCSETYEKTIFRFSRFLVSEMWSILWFFLVNDMQTLLPSKRAVSIFWSKKLRNSQKWIKKNQFSDFCDFLFLRYGRSNLTIWLKKIVPRDAECFETDFLDIEFFCCIF